MAQEKVIKIVADTSQAEKKVQDFNSDLKDTKSNTNELKSSLDKVSGGALSAFSSLKSGLSKAVKGFKSLRLAIAATGIGLLIIALVAVKKAFTSSEEGQNKFAKILGIIGSITGNLVDVLANLGEKIIGVFENPKQAIKDFANLIKQNIVNRFNGLLELIPNLGKAVSLLFKGKFSEAGKVATDAMGKVALGVDGVTDKINGATDALKNFTKEAIADANAAAKIADQRAKADKVERNLIVERATANRKIADLRFKAEQRDKFTAKERIAFLKEANDLEEDITKKEINAAKLRLNAKVKENSLAKSTKEDLDEEARLKAEVINLETKRLNLAKLLEGKIQSTNREAQVQADAEKKRIQDKLDQEEKERIEKAKKAAKDEAERQKAIKEIQDEFKRKREDEEAETELQKIELEKERKLIELENLNASEEQKAEIIKYYDEKITEAKKNERDKRNADELATEKTLNEAKNKIRDANINNISKGFQLIASLDKKNKALQAAGLIGEHGVNIAKSIISTKAANAAATLKYAAIPGGLALAKAEKLSNNISLGLGIAASGVALKQGLAALKAGGGGGSNPNVSDDGDGNTSAPSFNLVRGTDSNQIAESLQANNEKPLEAFVVGSSVTTQQELDNNKIAIGTI